MSDSQQSPQQGTPTSAASWLDTYLVPLPGEPLYPGYTRKVPWGALVQVPDLSIDMREMARLAALREWTPVASSFFGVTFEYKTEEARRMEEEERTFFYDPTPILNKWPKQGPTL